MDPIPRHILFHADELVGKDVDNSMREAAFVIVAGKLINGKLSTGEVSDTLIKVEVFNVSQTTATAINVIGGVPSSTKLISDWLGIPKTELKDHYLVIELYFQLVGDGSTADDITIYLDGLGGSVTMSTVRDVAIRTERSVVAGIVFPIYDPISGKSYDMLFCDADNWAAGETHNVTVVVRAYRFPDGVAVNPSRALV